jgi:formylglycine-generating enzyme required for sulfatase activity
MSTATAPIATGTEIEMKFAWIPPGRFLMGSDKVGAGTPVHRVTIAKGFWMGVYPVTQDQFEAVMGYNPSSVRGPAHPVENVNWFDAQEFCQEFGKLTGRPIRLPTEAEWEYACRASATSDYWSGNDEAALKRVGWFSGTSDNQTHPVGKLEKNKWGLSDVHGNVWEWCTDWFGPYLANDQTDPQGPPKGDARVQRGGCSCSGSADCRAAVRAACAPADRRNFFGFRACFLQG